MYSKQMGAIFANCREICNSNIYCLNKFVDFLRLRSLKVKKVKTKAIQAENDEKSLDIILDMLESGNTHNETIFLVFLKIILFYFAKGKEIIKEKFGLNMNGNPSTG